MTTRNISNKAVNLIFSIFAFLVVSSTSSYAGVCGDRGQVCRDSQYCNLVCPSGTSGYNETCGWECVGGPGGTTIENCPPGHIPDFSAPSGRYCGRITAKWHRSVGCCGMVQPPQECGDFYPCGNSNNPNKICKDCSQDPPYCPNYNALVEVGRCIPIPPPTKALTGFVWEDLNGSGTLNTGDKYWTTAAYPGASCRTAGQSAVLNVSISGQSAAAPSWSCNSGVVTYTTPAYSAGSRTFVLTPPNNYTCSTVSWSYRVCTNATCTTATSGAGTGCSATIPNYSGTFTNTLNWRVNQVTPRSIAGRVHLTNNITTCDNSDRLNVSGLTATAYNGATSIGSASVNATSGVYNINNNLFDTNAMTSVCINGNIVSGSQAYQLACVKGTNVTCTKGSGTCAVTCTPSNALALNNLGINFGFVPVSNDKWFSVIDGDIYGDSVATSVAANPLGGFSPYIVNTQTATTVGGYGFTANTLDTDTAGTGESEKGGSAERLAVNPSYPPSDQWLNKFSFSVPENAETAVPSGNEFEEGKVYSFSVDQFNSILEEGTYSFAGGNSNAPAAAIVYVTGSGEVDIASNFISDNDDKTLLVITTANVNITKDPGVDTVGYSVIGASQVDLAIITQGNINFESQYVGSTFDRPIMIYGGLMARGGINPDRNLGAINNAAYPSISVRFYPYLMELIKTYEIENATNGAYTGLTTVDVQFDYGD
jgi:hypothetical protein